MSADATPLPNTTPMTPDQFATEMFREVERLSRQLEDARHERDQYKQLYLNELARHAETDLTAEDIANAVPARPIFEAHIRRLEGK